MYANTYTTYELSGISHVARSAVHKKKKKPDADDDDVALSLVSWLLAKKNGMQIYASLFPEYFCDIKDFSLLLPKSLRQR